MNKIFLAHSSKDKDKYIQPIVDILEKRIGRDSFIYDKFNFNNKSSILGQIDTSLKDSGLFILFLSENSRNSKWVNYELSKAIELRRKSNLEIIVITIGEEVELMGPILNSKLSVENKIVQNINEAANIIEKCYLDRL